MTDHAATIRRDELRKAALAAADTDRVPVDDTEDAAMAADWQHFRDLCQPEDVLALLAERQQAIDERDKWAREAIEVQGDIVKLSDAYKQLEVRYEQAIDALRETLDFIEEYVLLGLTDAERKRRRELIERTRAALLSLGERES